MIAWSGQTCDNLLAVCRDDVNICTDYSCAGAVFAASFVEIMERSVQIVCNIDKHILYII